MPNSLKQNLRGTSSSNSKQLAACPPISGKAQSMLQKVWRSASSRLSSKLHPVVTLLLPVSHCMIDKRLSLPRARMALWKTQNHRNWIRRSKGSSNVGARETTQRNSTTEISQEHSSLRPTREIYNQGIFLRTLFVCSENSAPTHQKMRWSAPFQFVNSVKPPVTILVKGIFCGYMSHICGYISHKKSGPKIFS